jgi:hypothetical protein
MNVEQLMYWKAAEYAKKTIPNATVHNKSHMTWPGIESGGATWATARPCLFIGNTAT